MRILLINTSERIGGAAIAAGRLEESLHNNGVKAKMLVRDKQTDEISVVGLTHKKKNLLKFFWERAVIWKANGFKKHNLFTVDIANTGTDITSLPEFKEADVIHLHWINQGMLSLKNIKQIIKSGKPIVWTMHDMWPFTGICHHADDCLNYQTTCRNCPYLLKPGDKDLSYKTFRRKQKMLQKANITFVGCSQWIEGLAKKSALIQGFPITNIPNAINTYVFKPCPQNNAREKSRLPQDKKLLLFGSMKVTDKRKGFSYLAEACNLLNQEHPELKDKIGIVVVGLQSNTISNTLPFPVYPMNYVADEKEMVNIYNSVELYVTPSLQENLPNTIMEAMACGVPCVGFKIGGIPEMINHQQNGYLAEYKSAADLAKGIYWILTNPNYESLSKEACRKVVNNYSEGIIAKKYTDIYMKITGKNA